MRPPGTAVFESIAVLKAEPPPGRPVPGRRRPAPRNLQRKPTSGEKYAIIEVAAAAEDCNKRPVNADDFEKLQRTAAECETRCQQLADELRVMRRRSTPEEDLRCSQCCGSRPVFFEASTQTDAVDDCRGVRDADSTTEPETVADLISAESFPQSGTPACDGHWAQLEAVHREVGEKARELRRAQESVKLLQTELQEQRLVSEQYRSQLEVLEEQLTSSLMKRRREVGEDLADHIAVASGRSRPLSARKCRPTGETQVSRTTAENNSGETTPASVVRAWAIPGRKTTPRTTGGSQTPRVGVQTPADKENVDEHPSLQLAREKLANRQRRLEESSDDD